MDIVKLIVGQILPYVTIVVLVAGLLAKILRWNKAARPKLTLFPAQTTAGGVAREIAKEVFIFRSLFEGNRSLWAGSWVFHLMLAFIAVGHVRVVAEALFFLPREGQDLVSGTTGGLFGIVILLACIYLFIRRLAVVRVREISDLEDYLALGLIIAIVATGDAMRFIHLSDVDLLREGTRPYFASLVTFQFAVDKVPDNPLFLTHFFLSQVLFLYLPFSKFLHIPGVFYSQALLQKA